MKKALWIGLLALAGCGTDKPADNSATRYTKSLQQGVQKADAVAEKANAAIAEQNKRMNDAEALNQ